jgi:long-chain acyl-CoA synthetase
MLASTVARHGSRTAIWWRGTQHSWEELGAAVRTRAADFRERGVGTGDAVALMLPNGPDFVASFFAATSLGAIGRIVAPLCDLCRDGVWAVRSGTTRRRRALG